MHKIHFWIPEGYVRVFEDSINGENPDSVIKDFVRKKLSENAIRTKDALDRGFIDDRGDAGPGFDISKEILDKVRIIHNNEFKTDPPRPDSILYSINVGDWVHEYLEYFAKIGIMMNKKAKVSFEDIVQANLNNDIIPEIHRINENLFAQKERESSKKPVSKKKQ